MELCPYEQPLLSNSARPDVVPDVLHRFMVTSSGTLHYSARNCRYSVCAVIERRVVCCIHFRSGLLPFEKSFVFVFKSRKLRETASGDTVRLLSRACCKVYVAKCSSWMIGEQISSGKLA